MTMGRNNKTIPMVDSNHHPNECGICGTWVPERVSELLEHDEPVLILHDRYFGRISDTQFKYPYRMCEPCGREIEELTEVWETVDSQMGQADPPIAAHEYEWESVRDCSFCGDEIGRKEGKIGMALTWEDGSDVVRSSYGLCKSCDKVFYKFIKNLFKSKQNG